MINVTSPSAFIFTVKGEANVTIMKEENSFYQQVVYTGYSKNNLTSGILLTLGEYKVIIKGNDASFHYYVHKLKCRKKALCSSFLLSSNRSILIPIPNLETPEGLHSFLISNTTVTFEILQCNKIIYTDKNTTLVFAHIYFKKPRNVFLKIVVHANSLFYLSYRVITCFINPYLRLSYPSSEGIVSYGIVNCSTKSKPYFIKTDSIIGKFSIFCILAYNKSQKLVPPCAASLQLNVVLRSGKQVYWLQNVLEFLTSKHEIKLADDILNITCLNAKLSNCTITSSNGYVTIVNQSNQTEYYYGNYYCQPELNYRLPLCGYLASNISLEKCGVLISFTVILTRNGSSSCYKEIVYDEVLIHGNFSFAYLTVCGRHYTPVGSYYDAELVFGGGGNGEITSFSKLNASLWLLYLNKSFYVTFPNYFTFGEDTAEKAENITVNFCKYYAKLTTGKENLSCYKATHYSTDPYNSSTHQEIIITHNSEEKLNNLVYKILILLALTLFTAYLIFRKGKR
ncbi:hypothetical protein HS5_07690 [Acidianus sp. HS-5]|nr:hypothetical protein HS5_07690 [Acidianus sp. HS-5]